MIKITKIILMLSAFIIGCNAGYAADETPADTAERRQEEHDDQTGTDTSEAPRYVYEKPTPDKLALLYWALSKLDIENKDHINNFMLITECDIYQQYSSNEFEWNKIIAAAQAHIEDSKKSFPLRFEFMQPLKLGEYDVNRQRFEILDPYKINSLRKFEVLSSEAREDICGVSAGNTISNYPKGLVAELSRPVTLTHIPVEIKAANKYIQQRIIPNNKNTALTEEAKYYKRDAYLVMKIKVFAYKGEYFSANTGTLAEVLAVLEGYEVYADQEKKELLYSKYFRKKRRPASKTAPATAQPQQQAAPAAEAQ
jgi:hypothetical protein